MNKSAFIISSTMSTLEAAIPSLKSIRSLIGHIILAFLMVASVPSTAFALDNASASIVQDLVPFASAEGLARLARSSAKINFPALANEFEPQSNAIFCGPTSSTIVLNAMRGQDPDLPRDQSRLHAEDLQYVQHGFDLSLPRFTQDNVITNGRKTRAQVLGEPMEINGK
ncbi:MAG: phytochelatin synthase family protein, partial [Thiobacillaceae bacterium]